MSRMRLKDRINVHMDAIHNVREDPGVYDLHYVASEKHAVGQHIHGTGRGVGKLKPKMCPGCGTLKRYYKGTSSRFFKSGRGVKIAGRGQKRAHTGFKKAAKQTIGAYWQI